MNFKLKTIIRIEHSCGLGMFTCAATKGVSRKDKPRKDRLYNLDVIISDTHKNMPEPEQDGINLNLDGKIWLCAYKGLKQLKKWVCEKDIALLLKHNYKIYAIAVERYQEGECQVAYSKDSVVHKRDISSLFKI